MAVYRPKNKGQQSKFYLCEFVYGGKRIRESTGATSKTLALEHEKRRKRELERAAVGLPTEAKAWRIQSVAEKIASYLTAYATTHRAKSIRFVKQRLAHVERILGPDLPSDLTEARMLSYMRQRQGEGVCGRTVNSELGELSRVLGSTWRTLWPKVRKLEELHDVGKALSHGEQQRLVAALQHDHTPHMRTLVPLLLLTGMRSGEALGLTWGQQDAFKAEITVGRSKSSSSTGRVLPVNAELAHVLAAHRAEYTAMFGDPQPDWFMFAYGSPVRPAHAPPPTHRDHRWCSQVC